MIEKILREINRLKNELDGYSAREALDYIESYINTLEQPQLPSDVEETHYTKRNELFDKCVENCNPDTMKEVSDNIDKTLRTSDVEEAAIEYCYRNWDSIVSYRKTEDIVKDIFKAGAEYERGKFKKELDMWTDHSIRGMSQGNVAYFQGRIGLITNLQEWLKETEGKK